MHGQNNIKRIFYFRESSPCLSCKIQPVAGVEINASNLLKITKIFLGLNILTVKNINNLPGQRADFLMLKRVADTVNVFF